MLKPVYSSFPQKIWKIFPDVGKNRLSIETRDSLTKQVFGWAVSLDQASPIVLDLEQNWWRSLITVHEGYSIWQGIEEEGLPIPRGVYVYEQLTGTLVWGNSDLKFLYCGPEIVIAVNPQEAERIYFLDVRSGQIRDEVRRSTLPVDSLEAFEQDRFTGIQYPQHISPGSARYQDINMGRPPMTKQTGPVSYLKFREYELAHRYYHTDTNEIEGYISVRKQGVAILPDLPTGQYPNGFSLDSFFIINDWLVWVEFPDKVGRIKL